MYSKYSNYVTTLILLVILGISIACLVLIIQVDTSTAQVESSGLEVETSVGVIRGLQADDGDYSMFLGIPYAKVNRSNPFGASTPITYFEGGFDAIDDSSICPQEEEFNFTITGSLDCLDLNIYVPNPVRSTNKLSVMVYIFGGLFKLGFPGRFLYGPRFLVRHDVIFVTINYRLGIYGFLNLDIPEVPGNEGLRDQLMALRWIKQNIQYFGGNPDDITIFGHSAGAIGLDLLLHSETDITFNKIILQSASSLVTGSVSSGSTHRSQFLQLAEYLGLATSNIYEAIEFVSQIDELSVIKAFIDLGIVVNPTIESDFPGVEKIISNYSMFLDVPKARDVSVMIGFTNGESDRHQDTITETDLYSILTEVYQLEGDYLEEMTSIVRKFFIGDETELTSDIKYSLCDARSDSRFVYPIYRTINKLMESNVKNLYQYFFSYVGERNFHIRRLNLTRERAMHADELGYLFDISYMRDNGITSADQDIIDKFTTLWTNFAKYGDPTPSLTQLLPVRWLPVTSEHSYYYDINTEVSLGSAPFHQRMAFWELFYLQNEELQYAYTDNKNV